MKVCALLEKDFFIKRTVEQIVTTNPTSPSLIKMLMEYGKDEQWLKDNGYMPVIQKDMTTKWVKEEDEE